ncbi:MAG: tRNA pseudouridine55 synthase [Halanaerobium sp. 4-GBenrich]|jgi:tRNA pseudouridine55 synthase|uniref:tRNA pseudouridine synthase B n=1 Tax=Halanaerobium congolense TaxID=54121 RepID=A0A1G6I7T3_9FIRM|nr:tRNA pseudouridine(55) synthase TruB [Halanaerobium congolense]KXS50301.1 MAG: tRNA pseudouridine55 synthase [Halanaerobium sp. T82-1]ODS50921.1 MAG: tRNA pseudouridine55 synthase [Halanaerobium sp. 4-GBenrich]OEG62380.1 MAG: tRNA pseudouridine(55) synthase TruB [Halanaerobium sp. MDAL1]PUU92590.1 MAG: tRNA pseudouridine55 synthase [Halanaerobium sp.]PTX17114.1 tRNA pseudouridine synthase B [Halanaerobium congolense]
MFNGTANILKPPGISSFALIKKLRGILGEKKAGHTGTLDPAAAGVLGVCFGKATKIIPFLDDSRKEYICEMKLGFKTDTLDLEGETIKEDLNWNSLTAAEVESVIHKFQGKQQQIPPMYSALHYQGSRLYQLARRGIEVERQNRNIEIFEIEVLDINLPLIRFRAEVSRGTYIRSLVRDIGKNLNTNAVMTFLLRTKSGPFKLEEAISFEEVEKHGGTILQESHEILDLPHYTIKTEEYQRAANGNYLIKDNLVESEIDLEVNDYFLLFSESGEFLAISQHQIVDDYPIYQPHKVFI